MYFNGVANKFFVLETITLYDDDVYFLLVAKTWSDARNIGQT